MEINWNAIEEFIGFGNSRARVLFIGYEEGLTRRANLEEELVERSSYKPYEDLFKVQTALGNAKEFFGSSPKCQRTWRPMCHLMLRARGLAHPTLAQRNQYQANELGRREGDTLLAELLPYPHSDTGQWLYPSRFSSREDYKLELLKCREAVLSKIVQAHDFQIVVGYTKHAWDSFERIAGVEHWQGDETFRYGWVRLTRVILTHAFSSKAFNEEAALQRFADLALETR